MTFYTAPSLLHNGCSGNVLVSFLLEEFDKLLSNDVSVHSWLGVRLLGLYRNICHALGTFNRQSYAYLGYLWLIWLYDR